MNTVVDIVRSWVASDSSVNPTKEILVGRTEKCNRKGSY